MSAHPASEAERDPTTGAQSSDPQRLRYRLASDPLLLTPEEAARVLRVGRTTVYALMKAGELRPIHIGRSCRLSRVELERYVTRQQPQPPRVQRSRRRSGPTTDQVELFDVIHTPREGP